MTESSAVTCREERRREDVRQAPLFGLDFVEVGSDQTLLEVFFLGKAPPSLSSANVRIAGGSAVAVVSVQVHRQRDAALDDWLEVRLDRPGDFSRYTLALQKVDERGRPTGEPMDGFDPRFSTARFSFKVSCPSDLDCRVTQRCPPPVRVQPEINYLAKDYESFRQLIFDRLAQTMPDWHERHAPDIGVMLVELLAYIGDYLSYYQDAVATEAYLNTARQRISVRRHARLVDYAMHDGCNARAWVTIATDRDATLDLRRLFFCTPFPGAPATRVLQPDDFAKAASGSCTVFEPLLPDRSRPFELRSAHAEISFYTWGDRACCLPKGATAATLVDAWLPRSDGEAGRRRALSLAVNDVLIFEEIVGPGTGNAADADPAHRQAVRLTKVTPRVDALYKRDDDGQPVVEIEWCSEDALTFALCISAQLPAPDCSYHENISVARGNVILVDHGVTITESLGTVPTERTTQTCATDCEPAAIALVPGRFRPVLEHTPVTFSQELPPCGCASVLLAQDARRALPRVTLTGSLAGAAGTVQTTWTARADLLESAPDDDGFVVEVDDDGRAHLRFGDGDGGRVPDAGTTFVAQYRIGSGTDGNVGADTIAYLVWTETTGGVGDLRPRNPLAAAGGTASETSAQVRLLAPFAFRDVLERAVTADDYATLAADNARRLAERPRLFGAAAPGLAQGPPPPPIPDDPRAGMEEEPGESAAVPRDICSIPFRALQGAKGTLRWTGSWYEARVAIDPLGAETSGDELRAEVAAFLEPYRRIGHDVDVRGAQYVPLDLGLSICVLPAFERGAVKAAVLDVLGTHVLADGTLGLFHPDNLGFGGGVAVSRIVAAAQAIPGVLDVLVTRLARYALGTPAPGTSVDRVPDSGLLTFGPFEIAQLDNDPSAPANGRLTVLLRGGR